MRVVIITALIAASVLVLAGCTGYGQYMVSTKHYSTTSPVNVRVYAVTQPEGKYETLGYLSVYMSDARDKGDELKELLRERAAFVGADAIVGFKLNQESGGGGGAEGIAVKFLK